MAPELERILPKESPTTYEKIPDNFLARILITEDTEETIQIFSGSSVSVVSLVGRGQEFTDIGQDYAALVHLDDAFLLKLGQSAGYRLARGSDHFRKFLVRNL